MKVVLIDDHNMIREGLRSILEKDGVQVVGEASNGREGIAEVTRTRPDIVVIDIAMPEMNGVDATRRLVREMPGIKVVALSMNCERRYVMSMLRAGAVGYVVKSGASEELLNALHVVARGETYLSQSVVNSVVESATRHGLEQPSNDSERRPLSGREREVLQLVAEGKSSKEIATILEIGVPTVETHRRQVMDKLNLRTVAELTKYAIREGLTTTER